MTLDPDPRSVPYPDAALMPSPDDIAGREWRGVAVPVVVAVAVVLAVLAVVLWGLGL